MTEKKFYIKDLVIDDEYGVIESKSSILDAAKKMKELGVPDLVVTDESDKVLGVIADFDIVQNIVAEGKNTNEAKVIDAMYTIKAVALDTPVTEAFESMRNLQVNVVPVVENEKLLGVATIQDCWSYIPDENADDIGLIPVSNPKNAEFWLASVFAILAFTFGILMPLIGIFPFYVAPSTLTEVYGGAVFVGGTQVDFFMFEARNAVFFESFAALSNIRAAWILIIINGFLMIISGIIGIFSIIYASYSESKNIKIGNTVRIIPWFAVLFMALEWIFFIAGFGINFSQTTVHAGGLVLSIVSMLLIIVAINRNYLFRQGEIEESMTEEVSS